MKIILPIGISGSGKSTWVRRYIKNDIEQKTVIVSRDAIRLSLYGLSNETYSEYYAEPSDVMKKREKVVSKFANSQIWFAINSGLDVIVDNTHLRKAYINEYKKYGVEIELVIFDATEEEAVKCDLKRTKTVGSDVIKRQIKMFNLLMNTEFIEEIDEYNKFVKKIFGSDNGYKKNLHNVTKSDAVVVDLDGTVALATNRNVHDLSKVLTDEPNLGVAEIVRVLRKQQLLPYSGTTTNIIFCSGREDICREDTLAWLNNLDNGIVHTDFPFCNFHLRMRPSGTTAFKDWEIKVDLWRDIQADYNIIALIDDRDQIVHIGRRLGFTVMQVNYGDF